MAGGDLLDEAGVLGGQAEGELGRLVALVDALDGAVDEEVRGAAGADDLDRGAHVDARGQPPCDSASSDAQVQVKASRLLTSFIVVPVPTGPRWKVARPSWSSSGRHAGDRVVVAAHHEHERPALGADGAAGERGLHEVVAAGGEAGGDRLVARPGAWWRGRGGSTRARPRRPTPSATAATTSGVGSEVIVISLAAATSRHRADGVGARRWPRPGPSRGR